MPVILLSILGFLGKAIGVSALVWAGYKFIPTLIGNEVAEAVIALLDTVVNFVFGGLIAAFGWLINFIIPVQNWLLKIDAVQEGWKIFRDFSNLFFILLLIIIAFATIFNYSKYSYKKLLPKIIIVALLINFSFVIFQWTVDLLWVPANVFLKAMGEPHTVGTKLGAPLYLNEIQTREFAQNVESEADAQGGQLVFTIFKAILYLLILVALGWIALVLIIRLPILMGLAIISPLAWISLAFPPIKSVWEKWWHHTIQWGLIPLFYFAVIYFVLFWNSRIQLIINQVQFDKELAGFWPLTIASTILLLINFVFLFGGLYWAHQFANKSGAYGYSWISAIPYVGQVPGGIGRVWKGIQETGVKVPGTERRIGGAETRKRREEAIAGILGKPFGVAPGLEAQREFKKSVAEEQEKLARDLSEGRRTITDIEGLTKNLKTSQGAAAAILLAKRGEVNESQAIQHIKSLDSRTLAGQEYVKALTEGNFRSFAGGAQTVRDLAVGRGAFSGLGAEFLNAKQEAINYLKKERPEIIFENTDDLVASYEVMTQRSLNEAKGLLAEGKKKRVDTAMWAEYINEEKQRGRNLSTAPINTGSGSTDFDAVVKKIRTRSEEEFNRGNNDFFINQNLETYNDLAFQEALRQSFNPTLGGNPQRKIDLESALGPRNPQKARIVHAI